METLDIVASDRQFQPTAGRRMPFSSPLADHDASEASTAQRRMIAVLAGQLYGDAPTTVRSRILETLLRPMSVFSLIGVANGLFAQIKAGNAEWQGFKVRAEDIGRVGMNDVVELVDMVQRGGGDVVRSLGAIVAMSPVLAQSVAASALLKLLQTRANLAPVARVNNQIVATSRPEGRAVQAEGRIGTG